MTLPVTKVSQVDSIISIPLSRPLLVSIEQTTMSELISNMNLSKVDTPADGYCLLRAIEIILQQDELRNISLAEIKQLIREEIELFPDSYQLFYTVDISPGKCFNDELNLYLDHGVYNVQ